MSHKILNTYGENSKTKKLIMLAWENTPAVQRKEIRDRYLEEHLKAGKPEQQFDREGIHEDEASFFIWPTRKDSIRGANYAPWSLAVADVPRKSALCRSSFESFLN